MVRIPRGAAWTAGYALGLVVVGAGLAFWTHILVLVPVAVFFSVLFVYRRNKA
jgi:hypothetical protein